MRKTLFVALLACCASTAVLAESVWIAPAKSAATQTVGNWAVTPNGSQTYFSFGVPNDFDPGQPFSATLVLIGRQDKAFTLEVGRSVAADMDAQDVDTASAMLAPPDAVEDEVQEIDVSVVLPAAPEGGTDYLTIGIEATPATAVHIVGLRFDYGAFVPSTYQVQATKGLGNLGEAVANNKFVDVVCDAGDELTGGAIQLLSSTAGGADASSTQDLADCLSIVENRPLGGNPPHTWRARALEVGGNCLGSKGWSIRATAICLDKTP